MNKYKLRKYFLDKRDSLPIYKLNHYNNTIKNNFLNSSLYNKSNNIMIYISFGKEINTHSLIESMIKDNKNIIVPITDPKDKKLIPSQICSMNELELGFYNILTPKKEYIRVFNENDIDLIVVPGIVFDEEGYRLGYGGGYYDRFLSKLPNTNTIALSYDFQVIKSVPRESFDLPVDCILTENRYITIKK